MKDKFEVAYNLTAWFETSGDPYTTPSGNFDGQGISWGPRQNCMGQGSLQPLLRRAIKELEPAVMDAFGPLFGDLKTILEQPTTEAQTQASIKIANVQVLTPRPRWKLKPEWQAAFAKLGQNLTMQGLFIDDARQSEAAVSNLAKWIARGVPVTLRMYCLAYDIVTQNGGVGTGLRLALTAARPFLAVYKATLIKKGRSLDWAWMSVVAGCRALQTRITGQIVFAKDVAARKFLIIDGKGLFRGEDVDLEERFGVTDEPVA